MKLKKIYLRNFRCFDKCEIDFEDDLTVLVAPNGLGKTAILDAIAYGFGFFYRGFPGVKTNTMTDMDMRVHKGEVQAQASLITFLAEHKGETFIWGRQKRRNAAISNLLIQNYQTDALKSFFGDNVPRGEQAKKYRSVSQLNKEILENYNSDKEFDLPLIVYFGTDRTVRSEVRRRTGFKKAFTRFDALVEALDATTNFKKALEWFNAMEELERREIIKKRNLDYKREDLEIVRRAICAILPEGHSNLRTEMRPLRFVIDQKIADGTSKTLRLMQLSDGYRIVLAMVMDLARRMIEANPNLAAQDMLSTASIILIDEIDLHLHPEWQQTIIPELRKIFPKSQFIVTTHSPQVLTTVPARSLRKIVFDKNKVRIDSNFQFLEGARADFVLQNVLDVNIRPEMVDEVRYLEEYKEYVERNDWDDQRAIELRSKLDRWGKGYEAELEKIDIDIKVREFRRSRETKS
ncbi:AAA family ATPase [Brucella pseudogrignonensis]|uniref:AAA family ATPase n=1 Tax=Brucella pseudogrignonensis TaxID=419475 RepID=UPI003D969482